MRSSVICRDLGNKYKAFVKGSPEKIKELCTSQIPSDYDEVLESYTKNGYRVIALATKELNGFDSSKLLNVKRDDIESNLVFLGFLIMENKIKPESTEVLLDLKKCEVKCSMVTGDNILTAISVARQCNIIDSNNEVWIGDIVDSDSV